MYLQNKYTNVYNNIIARAKSRELLKEIFSESRKAYWNAKRDL
jgi:hypothetical protein